jgi:hypothetical protein
VGSLGTHPGAFARPRGITFDRKNRLYAVDAAFNNIQIFNRDGKLLLFFGKGGKGPGDLYLAAKVAVDYDNIKYFEQYAEPGFNSTSQHRASSAQKINVCGSGQKGKTYKTDEISRD